MKIITIIWMFFGVVSLNAQITSGKITYFFTDSTQYVVGPDEVDTIFILGAKEEMMSVINDESNDMWYCRRRDTMFYYFNEHGILMLPQISTASWVKALDSIMWFYDLDKKTGNKIQQKDGNFIWLATYDLYQNDAAYKFSAINMEPGDLQVFAGQAGMEIDFIQASERSYLKETQISGYVSDQIQFPLWGIYMNRPEFTRCFLYREEFVDAGEHWRQKDKQVWRLLELDQIDEGKLDVLFDKLRGCIGK